MFVKGYFPLQADFTCIKALQTKAHPVFFSFLFSFLFFQEMRIGLSHAPALFLSDRRLPRWLTM